MGITENMQQLERYGGVSRGKFGGQQLGKGECSAPVVLPKIKRRKVSAVRDFPEGCGWHAPQIHPRPAEAAGSVRSGGENSAGRYKNQAALEAEYIQASVTGAESQSPQPQQDSVRIEVLRCSNNSEYNVDKPVVLSNMVEGIASMNDEPKGSELPMPLDNAASLDSVNPSKHKVSELPKNSHETVTTALTADMVLSSGLLSSSPPTRPIMDENIVKKKTLSWNYPQRRKISAIRDFPSLAPCLGKEDCTNTIASSKSTSFGQERSAVEKSTNGTVRTNFKEIEDNVQEECNRKRRNEKIVSENLEDKVKEKPQEDAKVEDKVQETITAPKEYDVSQSNHESHTYSKDMEVKGLEGEMGKEIVFNGGEVVLDRQMGKEIVVYSGEVRGVEGKVGNEIMLHKNKSEQKIHSGLSRGDTQVHAGDGGLNLEMDRVVIQGLAAPNCPLMQRKGAFKPDRAGKQRCSGKKPIFSEKGKTKSIFRAKKSGTEISEVSEVSLKRKSSPIGKFAYHDVGKLVVHDEVDSTEDEVHAEDGGLNLEMDRVVIQCLMAAPICPLRQRKGAFKPDQARKQRYSGKKHIFSEKGKTKSIFRAKKSGTEISEGSLMRKSSPIRKFAYHDVGEVVHDEVDSTEDDEESEDFHVAHRSREFNVSVPHFGQSSSIWNCDDHDPIVTRNKVREILRTFQVVCRKLLQEEEAKSKQGGNGLRRVDLAAAKIVKSEGKYVNRGKKKLGPVPGVEVGDEFQYRVELAMVGLHGPLQAGIDYLKQGAKLIATSVVASGGYADDLDDPDVLIYMGSGGNGKGEDRQPEDQKLERGNLALKNSAHEKSPVRVIRGFKGTKASDSSAARAKAAYTYTYDGLYLVDKYWQEPGSHGKLVFRFQLIRIPGQPELAWNEVKKSKKLKIREGIRVNDISQGEELIPICVINTINDETPPQFKYITRMMYPIWCNPIPPRGCGCTDGCSESQRCSCAVKNGVEIPYNHNGAIVEVKPLVHECGPSCKCPPSCHNRVSQHGIKFQLEIFKTVSRGWGVRSLNSISSGSFICEYLGELLDDKEAEQRTGGDEYLFDIGEKFSDQTLRGGLSKPMDSHSDYCEVSVSEDGGFTIDAAEYGNVGRFINHSCSPNLYAQNVLYDHEDRRMPHIMLFAAENIPPLQELTYHYNYTIDQVHDSNGNIKMKSCHCGTAECVGRMY